MSTLSIAELRRFSDEVERARHERLRARLVELLALVESGPVTLEDAAEQLRSMLEAHGGTATA